ncbi:MAG: GTP cyclohydrolase I FolE2 [Phycisphaerales bacterium]|nr:GTP cyclohydrolase I FolE2 [Phycisphaerales bacterium]
MPDVQAAVDRRRIAIDKAGVTDITYPITLRTPAGGEFHTVARVNMYVDLPHDQKGTHMSRFLEVLNEHREGVRPDNVKDICRAIRDRLDAETAHLELSFTYFIEKLAPVTKTPGLMDYQVTFEVTADDDVDFVMGVRAPATTLCPCSKEISAYGAHNQRCEIEAKIRFKGMFWIEELVQIIESVASTEVFSVLKRPDEKFVTEDAFNNPKFVEDIVRDLAVRLEGEDRITWYAVSSKNFESIHNHNAYALITRDKQVRD